MMVKRYYVGVWKYYVLYIQGNQFLVGYFVAQIQWFNFQKEDDRGNQVYKLLDASQTLQCNTFIRNMPLLIYYYCSHSGRPYLQLGFGSNNPHLLGSPVPFVTHFVEGIQQQTHLVMLLVLLH